MLFRSAWARLNLSGGTVPYHYQWDNGDTVPNLMNVHAGNYSVTVIDANGCTAIYSLQLTEPPPLVLSAQGSTWVCIGQSSLLHASAGGGTPAYHYLWNSGDQSPALTVSPTVSTTYTVSVTDAHGFTAPPQSLTVNVYPELMAASAGNDTLCLGNAATLQVNAGGGNGGPYHYQWDHGLNGNPVQVTPMQSTLYSVTVSDQCGTPPVTLSIPVVVMPTPESEFLPNPASGCVPLKIGRAHV